jgi:eukaryotic-like serine/threonine-protein kinase
MSWLPPPPPPPPPRPPSRAIWKQWWFWAIVVVVILIAAGAGGYEQVQTEADESPPPTETATPTVSPTSPPAETARVPNVIGKSSDTARSRLEAAGFIVSVEAEMTNAAPAGTVLRQSAPPGVRIEVGVMIRLKVARPLPKIPKVIGKTLTNAKRTLKNAGFEIRKVTQQTSSKKQGTVISQSPAAGTSARLGRAVSLITAKSGS